MGNDGVQIVDTLGLDYCPYVGGTPFYEVTKGDITAGAKFKPSPSARIVGYKIVAGLQVIGGGLEFAGGAGLAGLGGSTECASGGLTSPVSIPAGLGGCFLMVNGADNASAGFKRLFFSIDDPTCTEKSIISALVALGIPEEKATKFAQTINGSAMMIGGGLAGTSKSGCAAGLGTGKRVLVVEVEASAVETGNILKNVDIALGLDGRLEIFAARVNAAPYTDWGVNWGNRTFGEVFVEVASKARSIRFNLEDFSILRAIQEGGKGGASAFAKRGNNWTSAEFMTIRNSPELWAKTEFYRGGQIIPKEKILKEIEALEKAI